MANVIIKDDARRAHEAFVLGFKSGGAAVSSGDREAAECIAARSREAYAEMKRMEEKRK